MSKTMDVYIDAIDGFEAMSFKERRAAVRKASLDDKMHTKSTLKSIFRVKPHKEAVSKYSYKNDWGQMIECFTLDQCVNMREPVGKPRSKAQINAAQKLADNSKANSPKGRAISLCKKLIEKGAVVIDTETTDLDGVAIQLSAVCCKTREVLFSSLIHTEETISEGAYNVHGIDASILKDAPKPEQIAAKLEEILKGKELIAFNAEFDQRICASTFGEVSFNRDNWTCAMRKVEVPVLGSTNRYGTISLSNAMHYAGVEWSGVAHDATADCLGTVDLIRKISEMI